LIEWAKMVTVVNADELARGIFHALAHPILIDRRGNLFALREDGTPALVAGPKAGSGQFHGAVSTKTHSAVATAERL
jgi:hypothetical protein